jgi:hypothetical protein
MGVVERVRTFLGRFREALVDGAPELEVMVVRGIGTVGSRKLDRNVDYSTSTFVREVRGLLIGLASPELPSTGEDSKISATSLGSAPFSRSQIPMACLIERFARFEITLTGTCMGQARRIHR